MKARPPDPSRELASDYSRRAAAYARHWAPVIHPMAHPLLSAMPFAGSEKILDVGTGTGALWPLINTAAPGAQLWGVDGAEGMLRAGGDFLRGRVAAMDATALGVRPSFFDTALLLFVLFHVAEPVKALREVRAALRPGGVLGLVVWGEDPGLPGREIWTEELDRCAAAPDPRDQSVMCHSLMDTPAKLADLARQAGFASRRTWSQQFVHSWEANQLLATQTHCGLPSRRLESLTPEARRECEARVRARLKVLTPSQLDYRVEVIYGIAARPL